MSVHKKAKATMTDNVVDMKKALDAACVIGERTVGLAIKQAFAMRDMRRGVRYGLLLLKSGRTAEARKHLEKLLKES